MVLTVTLLLVVSLVVSALLAGAGKFASGYVGAVDNTSARGTDPNPSSIIAGAVAGATPDAHSAFVRATARPHIFLPNRARAW